MREIILGKSGLKVTKTAMGCLPVQRCSEEEAVELLQAAYEGGIRYFDTAHDYTDSEKKIGMALADVRDSIVISTKSHKLDKNGVLKDIEESLERLKTDHIDLFQLHQMKKVPDINDPESSYAGALEAKRRGWVDHIGFTSHMIGIAEDAIDSGMFETCQFPFSYISAERDLELAKRCEAADMGFIAMKGLAGGLLTNVDACSAFMNAYPNVVPIWGIQRMEELKQWLDAEKRQPELNAELDAFIRKERQELGGTFCRGCGYCMPCTVGIEINNIARLNMLLRRAPWRQFMTDEFYKKVQLVDDCVNCRQCIDKCPYGLDQPSLLKYMQKDYLEFYETHKDLV